MSLAKNYARAFFEQTASSNGSKETVLEQKKELADFWGVLESAPKLMAALTAPAISSKEKVAVVQELTDKLKISKPVMRLLSLLGQNGRIGMLPAVIDALDEVRLGVEGGVLGRIVSAEPLDSAAIKEITASFTSKLKRKVEFKTAIDTSLLAGLKVTVNGVTYDGTLLSQLERLRESFVHGAGRLQ